MTLQETDSRRTAAWLARENQRLRAELAEVRRTSRKQIRDLEHAAAVARIAGLAAAEAEIRHLRDEVTALRIEAGQDAE